MENNKSKLTEEEIGKIKENQNKQGTALIKLGELDMSKIYLENDKNLVIAEIDKLRNEMREIILSLEKIYGAGTLNLSTFEIEEAK